MDTDQPVQHTGTQSPAIAPTVSSENRSATVRNLLGTTVLGAVLMVVQSVAYHHYAPKDGSVGQDVPFYFISALIGALIAAIGLFRVAHSRKAATTPRVGIVLAVLGLVVFPVGYYTPLTFIWGVTSYLLSRDAQPGPLRTAARILGIVALCLTPLVVLLRALGITYQVGG
jgi:hypothetical protein